MDCLECKNLEEVFESRLSHYIEARSAAYYRVSTELAAKKNVDMERARNDLEEHQLICGSQAVPTFLDFRSQRAQIPASLVHVF